MIYEQNRPISAITEKEEHNFQVVYTTPESYPKYYSGIDANFTSTDSPCEIDINSYLGYNGRIGYINVFGTGDIDINISGDGETYGSDITLFAGDVMQFDGLLINKIKIVHTGTNSAYRILIA